MDTDYLANTGNSNDGSPTSTMTATLSGMGVAVGDLKIGMWLKNDGTKPIPLYNNQDGSGNVVWTAQPGDTIGQIADFETGPNGATVIFANQAAADSGIGMDKLQSWLISIFPALEGGANGFGTARFADLQASVSNDQVASQNKMIADTNAQQADLEKMVTDTVGKFFSGIFGTWTFWELAAIGVGGYVLVNWKQFFKAR